MSLQELLSADNALRTLSFDDAHGRQSQIRQATLQDLKTWAGVHFPPGAVVPIQKYVEVLNKFSEMHFNAFQCIARPNTALLDCILYPTYYL